MKTLITLVLSMFVTSALAETVGGSYIPAYKISGAIAQTQVASGGTTTASTVQATNLWLSIPAQSPFPVTLQPLGMFGVMRMSATNQLAIPTDNTYFNVTNWNDSHYNGFTANTTLGYLTNSVAGYYRIIAVISFIGAASELYEVCVLTNGVDSEMVSSKKQFSTGTPRYDAIPVAGRMFLNPNTAVSLAVKNVADNTPLTIHRAMLDIGN